MFVVFCTDDDDFEPMRAAALEQAFAQVVCRLGLMYQFEPESDCWRLVLTDVERPDRSPDPIVSTLKKGSEARRDLMMQAVDGRLQNLVAIPAFEYERRRAAAAKSGDAYAAA